MSGDSKDAPLFRRRKVGSDCIYEDRDEDDAFTLWWIQLQFSLADFDDWVESAAPALQEKMLVLRARALDAFRSRNDELTEARVMHLRAMLELRRHTSALLPHAEAYLRYRSAQADRARGSGKLTEAAKERIRSQYACRVRDGQKYGAIKAIARALDVSEKTVSAIVRPKTLRK